MNVTGKVRPSSLFAWQWRSVVMSLVVNHSQVEFKKNYWFRINDLIFVQERWSRSSKDICITQVRNLGGGGNRPLQRPYRSTE